MSPLADFALYLVPRVAVGLVLVLVVARGLGRAPARLRHTLLASGLVAAFFMPLLAVLAPVIELPILPFAVPVPGPPGAAPQAQPGSVAAGASWLPLITGAWVLGALLATRAPLAALARLRRFARDVNPADPVIEGRFRRRRDEMGLAPTRARVVQSAGITAPVSWGVRHATLAFPRGAEDWPGERLDEALVHELAHVRRNDWFLTRLAEVCCAVYWFLPPVWAAATRLRLEAERACDEIVLARGGSRVEYAAHLLELARRERFRASSLLTSHMLGAPASELGRRVRAILNGQHRRIHMGRKDTFTVVGLCTVLFLTLAGVRATAAGGESVPRPVAPRAEGPAPVAPPRPVLAGAPLPALPVLATASGESPAPEVPQAERAHERAVLHRERATMQSEREQIEVRHAELGRELERVSQEREQLHEERLRLHEVSTALAREVERLALEQQEARQQMMEQQELLHSLQTELERERGAQDAARRAE